MSLAAEDRHNRRDRQSGRWRLWVGAVTASLFAGCALAVFEYETNWIAGKVGAYLVSTNGVRQSTGSIWSRLTSEDRARNAIALEDLPTSPDASLPGAVSRGTYTLERIPPSGLPTYLALEYRRSPADTRDTRTLIEDHRIFAIGQRLLTEAHLEITVSETDVAQEVERTIELAGGLTTSPDDTTHIDPVRADIERTVSDVIREQRRVDEADRIRSSYQSGHVSQIFLNQMMGAYRGELYEDLDTRPATFTIDTEAVKTILGIADEVDR